MPNGYTLGEARTRLATDWLDDANNRRWTTTDLDRCLQSALTAVVDDLYNETRGHRLREELSLTSDTSGEIDLSSQGILHLVDLVVVIGDDRIPVYPIKQMNRERPDNTARSFFLYFIPDWQIPGSDGHPLVGSGATAAPQTWRGLEDLVILEAAVMAAARDPKGRPAQQLRAHRSDQWKRVMQTLTTRTGRFPPRRKWYPNLYWHHVAEDEKIVVSRRF